MNRAFNRRKDKSGGMTPPEALAKNHMAYNVKFLGVTEVDQPKGTDVIRIAVRKLKFQRHIKKSEGHKTPKVELQVSIYGVKLLDPKTRDVQHNCQLHRISFCADDKTDKRIFTFICTEPETKKHICYVFDSEKCAEEITVSIGRAFDLAYRKFLESGGKDVEMRKQIGSLQKRVLELETENSKLKEQLQDLEDHMADCQGSPLLHFNSSNEAHMLPSPSSKFWGDSVSLNALSFLEMSSVALTPASSPDSSISTGLLTPPPSKPTQPRLPQHYGCCLPRPRAWSTISRRPPTDVFDMVPFSSGSPMARKPAINGSSPPPPSFSPPPPPPHVFLKERGTDILGVEPFDPFLCNTSFPPDVQSKLDEMQEGFNMGLTLEGTIFSLDPVDSHC
ncbi:PTB domain-containing engulfment adapter protein 1 isoform X1 [Salmo salar]|uniref:PTB domain-containing engulfment adapter protein 1 n=1 Tax=Salmo salar TaxID=8030 RepID=B5X0V2_SALSA|nr:PTB domain-containing engulfment adapter protein 1 isoform X1 [Salmo salar]XP_014007842.1 PTB domain-containing engulfment adapter protein 1 isoform X1 [Salmo salar]XP_045554026.1 PTB domain-containing engulfment adapter protein 1 isoform X1 [Salmo salar]ACI32933.1 PTB domain-containing engulfment adapter protein 1 [Salmo salar]|eukprot:XP_014007841.1 PREDICTED: PTB domain-containing engulfment adapter protein 1-like isoform X1 [Salmo salar]